MEHSNLKVLNGQVGNVHAAALILGAAGLLSRFLGILRDRLLAGRYGAGRELDIYYASFQIPDFLSILFLLGAGSAAILPIFQEYMARDQKEARRLINNLVSLFIQGSIVAGILAFFLIPWILPYVIPGFSADEQKIASTLSRIILLSPILLGLSSIFSSVTQSFEKFAAYALSPIFYNLGIILGILFFVPFWGVSGLAWGVVLGALLHFLIQFWTSRSVGFASFKYFYSNLPLIPSLSPPPLRGRSSGGPPGEGGGGFFGKNVQRVIRLSFPRVIAISISQLTLVILVAIGSTLAEGSIAVMQLAQNLYFVPIGIFGVSYSVAIFPKLSRSYIEGNAREFLREISGGIRMILFWIIPSAVLFIILRAHLVRVALGSGEFSWEDTRLTAAVLAALALAMFAGGLSALLIKAYYALENTRLPLFINISTSVFSVALAVFLTNWLSTASDSTRFFVTLFRIFDLPRPEVLGLALGYAIGLILNIVFLYFFLGRAVAKLFAKKMVFPWMEIGKIFVASIFAGIATYAVRASFSETLPLITFAMVLIQGAVSGAVGFAVYFSALYFMGSEDIERLIAIVRRRLFRMGILPSQWDGDFQRPDQNIT